MSNTLYAIRKFEHQEYLKKIHSKRTVATDYLKNFLVEKEPSENQSEFAYVSEYISLLFHMENVLENVSLYAEYDLEREQWYMDELTAAKFMTYSTAMVACTDDLLAYNVSFSLH